MYIVNSLSSIRCDVHVVYTRLRCMNQDLINKEFDKKNTTYSIK